MTLCIPVNSRRCCKCSYLKSVQPCFFWFVVLDKRTARFIQFVAVYFAHRSSYSARSKPSRLVVFHKENFQQRSAVCGSVFLRNWLSRIWVAAQIIQFLADCLFTFSNGFEHCLPCILSYRKEYFQQSHRNRLFSIQSVAIFVFS